MNPRSVPFTLDAHDLRGARAITARGRLVVGHGADTNRWLALTAAHLGSEVMVDLAGVTHIDAQGLGVLAALARWSGRLGGSLRIVAASPRVRQMLRTVGLDTLVTRPVPSQPSPVAA